MNPTLITLQIEQDSIMYMNAGVLLLRCLGTCIALYRLRNLYHVPDVDMQVQLYWALSLFATSDNSVHI